MQRRTFLQSLAAVGLTSTSFGHSAITNKAKAAPYEGPIYITIAAEGGWDVTSFCDPKANTTLNHWAEQSGSDGEVQTINSSPITYAPFATNSNFFPNHASKMMVVNGIDVQTNAHNAGVRHTFSGRFADGYPAFTALAAKSLGPNLPLAFLSSGAYRETAGLIPFTLMSNPGTLSGLVNTNSTPWGPTQFVTPNQMSIVDAAKSARLTRLSLREKILPRELNAINQMQQAVANSDQLSALEEHIPEQLIEPTFYGDDWNPLLQQAQMTLACAKAGLTVAADLVCHGFDTHANHDADHVDAINVLINGVNYLWQEAERLGIDDRLRVMITSDFSRTPEYNDGNGKDHWPINSAIFMEKNASWSNQVIGHTDNSHNAIEMDANLNASPGNGLLIQPKHLQQAMRRWAGIDGNQYSSQFPLDADDIPAFINLFG